MKIGDLLLPNAYQIQRGDPLFGLILGSRRVLDSTTYKVFLTNENTVWINESTVRDLFEVQCGTEKD